MRLLLLTTLATFTISIAFSKSTEKKSAPAANEIKKITESSIKNLAFKEADGKVSFLAIGKPAMIKIVGEGTGPQGELKLVDDKLQGTLSIDMTKLTTKIDLRDDHMKNKYLEVGKFPIAEIIFKDYPLKLSDITADSFAQSFAADLKLHGITKPISGRIKFSKNASTISGVATFNITVTDFLNTIPSYAGIKITDSVEVTVDLKTITQ